MNEEGKAFNHRPERLTDHRMRTAGIRALESHQRLRSKADRLSKEMDDLTPVHGVPVTGLAEDDSIVTSIQNVISQHKR